MTEAQYNQCLDQLVTLEDITIAKRKLRAWCSDCVGAHVVAAEVLDAARHLPLLELKVTSVGTVLFFFAVADRVSEIVVYSRGEIIILFNHGSSRGRRTYSRDSDGVAVAVKESHEYLFAGVEEEVL